MSSLPSASTSSFDHFSSSPILPSRSPLSSSPTFPSSPTDIPTTTSLPPLLTVSPDASNNESPHHHSTSIRRSSSPTLGGDHTHNLHQHHTHSMPKSISPQLMSIQEVGVMVTPTSSPMMRGRFVGGMKKIFRLPSSGQAGVATSAAQAYIPTAIDSEEHPHLEQSERNKIFRKVMKQIKRPHRVRHPGLGLRRPVHRKRAVSGNRNRERPHYSDDGYTSDPGLLREVIRLEQVEDQEEEEDTESGDREGELRAERIARLQMKLEHCKKLLQEEENALQEVENEYVVGMEISVNDKDQQKIKKSFINKQSKAKDGIDQLKKKVERYEEQLNYLQQGGQIELTRQPGYSHKVRDQFNRIRTLGGVKNGIRRFRKKKRSTDGPQASIDIEDEEELYPDDVLLHHSVDDMLCGSESQASFPNGHIDDLSDLKDDQPCEYCLNEYHNIIEAMDVQKKQISELQQQYSILYDKLKQERDKTDRLESELNTLTDLHQNGVIELRGQLAQMERLTFSKSQDLEDTIDNCQTRLHKLEVQIVNTADRTERPVSTGMIRRIGVPFLSYLLDFVAVCFKLSEHLGSKTFITLVILLVAVIIFYVFYRTV